MDLAAHLKIHILKVVACNLPGGDVEKAFNIMTKEGILSLPINPSLDSVPICKGLPTGCHSRRAEPLHCPCRTLHTAEHMLGDKAATATRLHDSQAVWPWEIQDALLCSGVGVHHTVKYQFL